MLVLRTFSRTDLIPSLNAINATYHQCYHQCYLPVHHLRILVMHQGQVAEYDTPRNLLGNPNSVFSSMVAETGPQNASHLRALAGF